MGIYINGSDIMLQELHIKDEYEVEILKQDHFGRGLAKIKNILVFVKEALPSEICKIEIIDVKKNICRSKNKENNQTLFFSHSTRLPLL